MKALVVSCSMIVLPACSESADDPGLPYRAQVLVALEAASPEDPPGATIKTESFSYLSSLKDMDGAYFRFLSGGRLSIDSIEGSQVSRPSFSGGQSPELRYRMESGVIVPRDYSTLAMLSAYRLLEGVFEKLESFVGISPDEVLKQNGKMEVLFEPSIVQKINDVSLEVILKLNAAYVPGEKQFVLFRRSAVEKLPLAMNLQVIAHEFGHSLFELSFYENQFNESDRFANDDVIKGMNEGYADLVSWAVTGSANVLRNSLDFDSLAEPRNFASPNFNFSSLASPSLYPEESRCEGGIYCVGTLFANGVLRSHREINSGSNASESRHETLRLVYQSLLGAKGRMKAEPSLYPEQSEALPIGVSISAFLRAFLQGMPDDWKPVLCSNFSDIFGPLGFSQSARQGVCSS